MAAGGTEEIVIPDLDDFDDYAPPSFSRGGFGQSSSPAGSDVDLHSHHSRPSIETPYFGGRTPSVTSTPARPTLPKVSASFSGTGATPHGFSYELERNDRPKLGKFSNGSSSSLVGAGTSISSNAPFLAPRKGSMASLRNAFKIGSSNSSSANVPPVPTFDAKSFGTPGYPALRNPFSKLDSPQSPAGMHRPGSSKGRLPSTSSPAGHHYDRKQSVSSQRSHGGRSVTSNGSSNFRAEDVPLPALPPIPMRATPSRMGRQGSDAGSLLGAGLRRGSIGGDDFHDSTARTPADEALRAVFRDFKQAADAKVSRICARPLNTTPSLTAYLDQGVDDAFDGLIASLAQCGRRNSRRVVDSLGMWCKGHCEGIGASEVRAHLDRSLGLHMRVEDAAAILGNRKSSAARIVLNRCLIAQVKSCPREALGEELGNNLELNAFNSYRLEKLEESSHPHRKAVSQLQVELLGELSQSRFLTISHRFLQEISRYASQPTLKDADARIEHLLHGMRCLKIRVYPEEELEASSELLQNLASFFANAHGQTLKVAYAEAFTHLLHPVIETATAEVNYPMWAKAVALILQRAYLMAAKPRYWASAFPLIIVALGVSPREVIMQNWQPCVDSITNKLKDRSTRTIAMNSFTRLLWIYLNRCSESATSMRKRLDHLLRVFFSASGPLYPSDIPLEPFVAILHYIMIRQLDYGEEFVSEFLRDAARPRSADSSDFQSADRATALIRASLLTLRAMELEQPSKWPSSCDFGVFEVGNLEYCGDDLSDDTLQNGEVASFLSKCSPLLLDLLHQTDRQCSQLLLSNDSVTLSAHASNSISEPTSSNVTRKHGDIHAAYPARFEQCLRLLAAVLDSLPRCLPADVDFGPVANILCRATYSAEPFVCEAAAGAMRRVATHPDRCVLLLNTFREFTFETRHVFRDTFIGSRLLESQFERIAKLYLGLLQLLVQHQRSAAAQDHEDPQTLVHPGMADKIEGSALFLLCLTSLPLRKLAIQILSAARDLESSHRRPSAAFRYSRLIPDRADIGRVIEALDRTCDETEITAMRSLPWCTSSDRHRLDILSAPDRSKLLLRVAESDHPKDGLLWLALLPHVVTRLSQVLSSPIKELRNIVTQVTLRLQGHIAATGSLSAGRATIGLRAAAQTPGRTTADTTALADTWRALLCVLTVTMAPANSIPATPPVQRTKEAIILTPDTIGSPALFHYLTSLLSWEDPRFKDAAVYALGSIGQTLLRPLSEILLGVVRRLGDGNKSSSTGRETTRRTTNGPVWSAVALVFRLISPLILDSRSSSHHANLSSMIGFIKVTQALLSDPSVKADYDLQSLRRSFCVVVENLTNALGKLEGSDRFLGTEMRGAIFKLCYEWCHVGRRPDVAKARESQTLQAAAESYRGERDRAQYLDDLQAKTKLLSAAAAEAMAGLCLGQLITTDEASPEQQASESSVEPLAVLRWIRGMFSSSSSSHHETGRKALHALLRYNWSCERLLDEVLHQSFGEGEQFSLASSFFGVLADILVDGFVELPIHQTACLALSKLGHPVPDVRQRAFQLCMSLCPDDDARLAVSHLLSATGSSAPNVYREAQKEVSARLAHAYADDALPFLAECTNRLSQLEAPRRQATLGILSLWLEVLHLGQAAQEPSAKQEIKEHQALSNLMYLAIRFSDDHLDDIREILVSFAGSEESANTTALVKYLFEQGGKRRSPDFVAYAQKVIACLAQSAASETIFEEISAFVEPSAMASITEGEVPPSPGSSLVNLDSLIAAPSARSQPFSTGQLALLFAGELLPARHAEPHMVKQLCTLLHVALVHCDSPSPIIRDQCQVLLFQVLRTWITDTVAIPAQDTLATWTAAEAKLTALARQGQANFWRSDDPTGQDQAFMAPAKMTGLILKILGILLPMQPRLRQQWGETALVWATSCPIRLLACRSFQVFRILSPKISARMLSDTLARLSSTIASASPEIQSFNREVLRTFAAITQTTSTSEITSHPQIFWSAMACLTTPFEDEFFEVIELLSHVLDKTNLSDPAVVQHLLSYRPADWVGPEPHLQSLLLVGLRSNKTALMTFDLIRRLASASTDELVDPPADRLLHGFIAALPWMLHSLDVGEPNDELAGMALDLAAMADAQDHASFSRLLTSFAKARFRAKDDFIRQACSLLRDFMPTHALEILTVLLGFVLNDSEWMREKSMQVLKLVLQFPDTRGPLAAHGGELLQPLLRLVSTKLSAQALDVLDLPAVTAPPDSAVPADAQGEGTIFGPISPSGWSVPHAKDLSALTRENVTAVFNTCAVETRAASAHFSVVQFTDVRFNPSQISLGLPSPPLQDVHGSENDLGDLVGALHSLNQFFDDGLEGPMPGSAFLGDGLSPKRDRRQGHRPMGSDMSDRRLRMAMARGRNQSITSPLSEIHPTSLPAYGARPGQARSRHRHNPSDAFTSSTTDLSSTDYDPVEEETGEGEADASVDPDLPTPTDGIIAFHPSAGQVGGTYFDSRAAPILGQTKHRAKASTSSSFDMDADAPGDSFALDDADQSFTTTFSTEASTATLGSGHEGISHSQQSTPVMMRRTADVNGSAARWDRTPSPLPLGREV